MFNSDNFNTKIATGNLEDKIKAIDGANILILEIMNTYIKTMFAEKEKFIVTEHIYELFSKLQNTIETSYEKTDTYEQKFYLSMLLSCFDFQKVKPALLNNIINGPWEFVEIAAWILTMHKVPEAIPAIIERLKQFEYPRDNNQVEALLGYLKRCGGKLPEKIKLQMLKARTININLASRINDL
jgi:hypothetical protein